MLETERKNIAALKPRVVTDVEAPYWEALQRKKIVVQKCGDCGHVQSPPSKMCTKCTSYNVNWIECSGKATLWSRVAFHKRYLEPYSDVPYHVAIVRLEEGPLITGRLAEEYAGKADFDKPVVAEFYDTADGTVILGFRPA